MKTKAAQSFPHPHTLIQLNLFRLSIVLLSTGFAHYKMASEVFSDSNSIVLAVMSSASRSTVILLFLSVLLERRFKLLSDVVCWILSLTYLLYITFSYYSFLITGVSGSRNLTMWFRGGQGLRNTASTVVGNFQDFILFSALVTLLIVVLSTQVKWIVVFVRLRTVITLMALLTGVVFTEQVVSLYIKDQNEWVKEQEIFPAYFSFIEPALEKEQKERSYAVKLLSWKRRDLLAQKVPLPEKGAKPNIFIFVIESLATRFITDEDTPNIFAFRKDGISFTHSLANSNGTHHSWFGIFVSEHPLYFLSAKSADDWSGAAPLKILKRLGYDLKFFDSANIDYLEYRKFLSGSHTALIASFSAPSNLESQWEITDELAVNHLIEAISTLKANDRKLFICLPGATHFPYLWPGKSQDRKIMSHNFFKAKVSWTEQEKFRNDYKAAAHFVDIQFGRFIQALKNQGLYENSIIVLTGDHGEELFENGFLGHGSTLMNTQIQTPIILKIPNRPPVERKALMSQIDIFPTIFDSMGLLSEKVKDTVAGRSMFLKSEEPNFVFTDKVNGYETNPKEFTLTNHDMKVLFRLNTNAKDLSADTLTLQNIYDMDDHPITGIRSYRDMRKKFEEKFAPALVKMGVLEFIASPQNE